MIWKEVQMTIRRGDMFYADLSPVVGSEQGGIRPVVIIQNDMGNKYSPTVIAAAITSKLYKTKLPTHIEVSSQDVGLKDDSIILTEQIRTIDKSRLKEKIGHIQDQDIMARLNNALVVSFGLQDELLIIKNKKNACGFKPHAFYYYNFKCFIIEISL